MNKTSVVQRCPCLSQDCVARACLAGGLPAQLCSGTLAQVRAWLDEAQEELLETQAALQEREAECRRVSAQLEAMQAGAGAQVSSNRWAWSLPVS